MKKVIAIVVVMLVLVMSLTAQAKEGIHPVSWRVEGNKDSGVKYYVTYRIGESEHEFSVPENDFNLAVEEIAKVENKIRLKERNAQKNWFQKTITWLSFWNPND